MNQTSLSLAIFFEDPFWIGLFGHHEQQLLYLERIVFGNEPGEQVVYERLKGCWHSTSSQALMETTRSKVSHQNPKRMQREARKVQDTRPPPIKSQFAVEQQQEGRAQRKAER